MPSNPFQPSQSLVVKLGSITAHVQEMLGPNGHVFDKVAIQALIADREVQEFLTELDSRALLPVQR